MHPPVGGQTLGSSAVVWAIGFALLRPVAFLVFSSPQVDLGKVVSRILSAPVARRRGSFIYCDLTRSLGRFRPRDGPSLGPLFGLAPNGVFRAASLALGAVGSCPTFSPLPRPKPWRFVFCGTFRQSTSRIYCPRVSRSDPRVTRHRALWCSDFPLPVNQRRKRSSTLPRSVKILG